MLFIEDAIILAGGKGTRLRSVTSNLIPKGLTQIRDRPILEWEIEWLAKNGVKHIILAIGHLADVITQHFGDNYQSQFGNVAISISEEKQKLGSGGAFKAASELVKGDHCFVVNGDIISNVNLRPMMKLHQEMNAKATMLLTNLVSRYGIVEHENNLITNFIEKPVLDIQIHAGVDIINREIFGDFPDIGQMEETIFVDLMKKRQFAAYSMLEDEFWIAIDTEKDYKIANENWNGL